MKNVYMIEQRVLNSTKHAILFYLNIKEKHIDEAWYIGEPAELPFTNISL